MTIAVLLGTYNGGRYLKELLESLLFQTINDFQLYIRDDGSTDDTIQIIQEYQQRYSNITIIENKGKNAGAKKNFELLLTEVKADYYMFCDQDDVWLPNKIEVSLTKLKQLERQYGDIPLLVHTDLKVVDENLRTIDSSFWHYCNTQPQIVDRNIYYLGVANSVTGCTIMMNDLAKQVSLPFPDKIFMHDAWIALCVKKHGQIDYIEDSTILYRQHGTNVFGAIKYHFSITDKLKHIKTIYKNNLSIYYNAHPLVFKNFIHFLFYKFKFSFFIFHKRK